MIRILRVLAATAAMLGLVATAYAQKPTPREFAMLPHYCKHTQQYFEYGGSYEEQKRYMAMTGGVFHHMHHYCTGLLQANRARFGANLQKYQRDFLWGQVVSEINYVLPTAPRNFYMLPEMLTNRGEAFIHLNKIPEAVADLVQAINMKPDYWPPYVMLADYLSGIGDIPKARDWLEKGIAAAPDSKTLRNRLAELDKGRKSGATSAAARQSEKSEKTATDPANEPVKPVPPPER